MLTSEFDSISDQHSIVGFLRQLEMYCDVDPYGPVNDFWPTVNSSLVSLFSVREIGSFWRIHATCQRAVGLAQDGRLQSSQQLCNEAKSYARQDTPVNSTIGKSVILSCSAYLSFCALEFERSKEQLLEAIKCLRVAQYEWRLPILEVRKLELASHIATVSGRLKSVESAGNLHDQLILGTISNVDFKFADSIWLAPENVPQRFRRRILLHFLQQLGSLYISCLLYTSPSPRD